jgi:hypothetical protein
MGIKWAEILDNLDKVGQFIEEKVGGKVKGVKYGTTLDTRNPYVEFETTQGNVRINEFIDELKVWRQINGAFERDNALSKELENFINTLSVERVNVENPTLKKGVVIDMQDYADWFGGLGWRDYISRYAEVVDEKGNSLGTFSYYRDIHTEYDQRKIETKTTGIFEQVDFDGDTDINEIINFTSKYADLVSYTIRTSSSWNGGRAEHEYNEDGYVYKGQIYTVRLEEWDSETREYEKEDIPNIQPIAEWLERKGFDKDISKFLLEIKLAKYEIPEDFRDYFKQIMQQIEKNPPLREYAKRKGLIKDQTAEQSSKVDSKVEQSKTKNKGLSL